MGTIVDIISLDQSEIRILKKQYPDCVLINQTNTNHRFQQYRVEIPGEDQYEDGYYNFLLDNLIAMSSRNFKFRLEYDHSFKERMRERADANLRRIKEAHSEE